MVTCCWQVGHCTIAGENDRSITSTTSVAEVTVESLCYSQFYTYVTYKVTLQYLALVYWGSALHRLGSGLKCEMQQYYITFSFIEYTSMYTLELVGLRFFFFALVCIYIVRFVSFYFWRVLKNLLQKKK